MVIDKLAKKLTDKWTSPQITKDQREVYNYGLQIILTYLTIIIMVAMLSLIFHQFWLTGLYLFGFLIQRYISGGYHAKNDVCCIGLTLVVCLAYNLLILYQPVQYLNDVNSILFIASAAIIWWFAPVDYAARFSAENHLKHKRQGRRMILFFMPIIMLGWFMPAFKYPANAMAWGYVTAAVSVLAGYYFRRR